MGAFQDAEHDFEAVLRLDPDSVSAMIGLATIDLNKIALMLVPQREPSLARAQALLDRVIGRRQDNSTAHYLLGMLQRLRGENEAALVAFARALDLNPSLAPVYAQAGQTLTKLGRPDEALEHIRYAIRLSPNDPLLGVWLNYGGIAEVSRGNDQAALDWLNRALAMSQRSPSLHIALAAAYALTGDMEAAGRHVRELRKLAPSHDAESLYRWFGGTGRGPIDRIRFWKGVRIALDAAS
jgi:tetratricopeptide (TPR) repeat protein